MGRAEFGQRLTRGGYRICAVPDARAQHLHEFTFRGVGLDVLRGVCVLVAVGGYLQERARERRVL